MIGVLTMFGETDLQPLLKKLFVNNDLFFICENCNTGVQLLDRVSEHYKETDVVIVAATAMNMDAFSDMVNEIRTLQAKMRIVLVLNGNSTQYMRSKLAEYHELRIDIIYDDDGFDPQDLVDIVKKGKLSKQKPKDTRPEIERKEFKPTSRFNRPKNVKEDAIDVNEEESAKKTETESFGKPTGKFTIAVFNVSRGAGATTAVISMARYFALHDYDTKIADLSGTDALELVKLKNIKIGIGNECIDDFKRDSNLLIIDFGTPYEITPTGDEYKISYGYPPEHIREITKCNIKVVMGFSDEWNVGRIKFLLNNEQWKGVIDDSYIFLTSGDGKKLKSEYPDINIMCRDDDYREEILNTLREAE